MNAQARSFHVLAIDGGGIRGPIPAAILAFMEDGSGECR